MYDSLLLLNYQVETCYTITYQFYQTTCGSIPRISDKTMFSFGASVLFLIVFFLVKMCMTGRRPKGMPPGPAPWPFLGNLDIICWDKQIINSAKRLGDKYNGMFGKFNIRS